MRGGGRSEGGGGRSEGGRAVVREGIEGRCGKLFELVLSVFCSARLAERALAG